MANKVQQGYGQKLFGGKTTAEELWKKHGLGGAKCLCGRPGAIKILIFCGLVDFYQRFPSQAEVIAATNPHGPFVPSFPSAFGHLVKLSEVVACEGCQKTAEMEAAKAPSWCIVDIQRGPAKDVIIGQVPA
jgi:hypothetical protein